MYRVRNLVSLGAASVFALLATGSLNIPIENYIEMQHRANRAEVPANVAGIKTAQLAYDAAFDTFVPVPQPHPRPAERLDAEAVDWPSGSRFDTLGWSPDGPVRGTYWVEVRPDGEDFVVHGMIDDDGDGIPAHYTATKTINALLLTPSGVY